MTGRFADGAAPMTEQPGTTPPRRDGFVAVEPYGDRCRVSVRHSGSETDFLWLSAGEALDVVSGLSALPGLRRARAAAYVAPLTDVTEEDWRYIRHAMPDLVARLRAALFPGEATP
jgi:hypothetical protein